jgi:hypothetical protein
MSGWGAWFGGGAAKKKDAPKNAILQLRGQLEMLSKREKHLQTQMEEQEAIARKNVSGNKKGAHPACCLGRGSHVWGNARANVNSRHGCPQAKKAVRALSRADKQPDHDPRARDIFYRDSEHQQGDARGDEERKCRYETNTWWVDYRQSRSDHVGILLQ